MNDMSSVIEPKSDQINADDLIAGPMTITIREVKIKGGQEQPVSLYFDGSDKAFRPCKSMSRVLVHAWGADAKVYVGRSLTLYRDPTVKWGGLEVGGIRISHMSHIAAEKLMMLTATRGSRKPHKVLPLKDAPATAATTTEDGATKWANGYIAKLGTFETLAGLQTFADTKAAKLAELHGARPDLHEKVTTALAARTAELQPSTPGFDDDDFGSGGTSLADQLADRPDEKVDTATGEVTNSAAENITENITDTDDDHPGTAIADAIIAEINKPETNAVMAVAAILNRSQLDMAAMRDEDVKRIDDAADARRAAIRAEQAKAKVGAE